MSRPTKADDDFIDYYEVLQLSATADGETIDRVYRMLAKRYHPDNHVTGNADRFRLIAEAHRILSNPEQRAAFDARYEESRGTVLQIFDATSNPDNFAGDQRIFDALLSLLYISRRRDARKGGLGILQLERLLGCPSEHLEFHTWYLRQKGWIERLENGQLTITADGVDRVIERNTLSISQDRLLAAENQPHHDPSVPDGEHNGSNGAGSANGQPGHDSY